MSNDNKVFLGIISDARHQTLDVEYRDYRDKTCNTSQQDEQDLDMNEACIDITDPSKTEYETIEEADEFTTFGLRAAFSGSLAALMKTATFKSKSEPEKLKLIIGQRAAQERFIKAHRDLLRVDNADNCMAVAERKLENREYSQMAHIIGM